MDRSRLGKAERAFMKNVVYKSLGSKSNKVLRGPGDGLDIAAVSIGGQRVLIVTTDPVSVIPALGMKRSAWMSVHLVASDYTTCGSAPEFATFAYNFPPGFPSESKRLYVEAIGSECRALGISIVAGHTGSYPGAGLTVVGAATMFGATRRGSYVDASMSREGDSVIMTKGSAIEATGALASSFPNYLKMKAGKRLADRASGMLGECSTVVDALTAASTGMGREGVTSMHDATEGGVLGGLGEMSAASGNAFEVDLDRIRVSPESNAACSAFGLDPFTTLSEGTLLITSSPKSVERLREGLRGKGIPSFEIGRVRRGRGLWVRKGKGRAGRFHSSEDRYWLAYQAAVASGLT